MGAITVILVAAFRGLTVVSDRDPYFAGDEPDRCAHHEKEGSAHCFQGTLEHADRAD